MNSKHYTKAKAALKKAIEATSLPDGTSGSISALARAVGVARQAVSQWDVVPLHRVVDVEKATGVSRKELRPDFFGE